MNKAKFLKLQNEVKGKDFTTAMDILGDNFEEYMDKAINEERRKNGFEPANNHINIVDVKKED